MTAKNQPVIHCGMSCLAHTSGGCYCRLCGMILCMEYSTGIEHQCRPVASKAASVSSKPIDKYLEKSPKR
jgi:hypothetical protein